MAKSEKDVVERRDFLKLASLSAVIGGAAIVSGNDAKAAEVIDPTGSGYRETVHVKTYYDLARF